MRCLYVLLLHDNRLPSLCIFLDCDYMITFAEQIVTELRSRAMSIACIYGECLCSFICGFLRVIVFVTDIVLKMIFVNSVESVERNLCAWLYVFLCCLWFFHLPHCLSFLAHSLPSLSHIDLSINHWVRCEGMSLSQLSYY